MDPYSFAFISLVVLASFWITLKAMTTASLYSKKDWQINELTRILERVFNINCLRAILQESETKLEMKIFNPRSFFCGGRLPGGINKTSHIWIGRCVVAMVTAFDHVSLRSVFCPADSLSRSKNKRVWLSGACKPIQTFRPTMLPVGHFDKEGKQAQSYWKFLRKYSSHINQICSRAYIDTEVSKYHKIYLGKIIFWPWVLKTSEASCKKLQCLEILRAPVFGSNRL